MLARLRKGTGVSNLVGASGEAVIGPGVEAQIEPAVSFLGVSLPGLEATTISLPTGAPLEPAMERVAAAGARAWLIFADPFSIDAEPLVRAMEARARDVPLLGGLASSHDMRGGAAVFAGGEVQAGGAVLVGLKGEFNLHSIVAQGAEPIGQPWTVTACEGNIVRELGSRPALEVLQDTLASLDPETRARAQRNLLVGLAMDEYRYQHGRGDYLVRNVMGGDRESGAISVNAIPRVGQTFQFQFRDAAAADEDLRAHLAILKQRLLPGETVVGGGALRLQRPRPGPVRHAAPRRAGARRRPRAGADGRDLRQRRDRPRGRDHLPARLHGEHRAAHRARTLAALARNGRRRGAMVQVTVTFALEPEVADRIRAVDPSVRVRVLNEAGIGDAGGRRALPEPAPGGDAVRGDRGRPPGHRGALPRTGATRWSGSCGPTRSRPRCAGCSSSPRARSGSTRRWSTTAG